MFFEPNPLFEGRGKKRQRNDQSVMANNNIGGQQCSTPLVQSLSSFLLPLEMVNNQIDVLCQSMQQSVITSSEEDRLQVMSILSAVEQRVNEMKQNLASTLTTSCTNNDDNNMMIDCGVDEIIDDFFMMDSPVQSNDYSLLTPTSAFAAILGDPAPATSVTQSTPTSNSDTLYMNTDLCAYTFSFLESEDYLNCLNVCKQWRETGINSPIAIQTVSFSNKKLPHEFMIQFVIDHVQYRFESVKSFYNVDPRVINWLFSKGFVLEHVHHLTMNERFLVSPKLLSMIKTCFPHLNRLSLEKVSKNCCDVTTLFSNLTEIDVVSQSTMFYNSPDIYESVHTLHLEIFQSTELTSLLAKFPNLKHLRLQTRSNDSLEIPSGCYTEMPQFLLKNRIEHLEIDQLSLETLSSDSLSCFCNLSSIIVHTQNAISELPGLELLIRLNSKNLKEIRCRSMPASVFKAVCQTCTSLRTLSCDIATHPVTGIENLQTLTSLDITSTTPSENCVEKLKSLEHLSFSSCKIDFSRLPKLRSFTLKNEKDLLSLSIGSSSLRVLDLTNSKATDVYVNAKNLQTFIGCSSLQSLKIDANDLLELRNISGAKKLLSFQVLGHSKLQELQLLNKNDASGRLDLMGCRVLKSLRVSNKFAQRALAEDSIAATLRKLYLHDVTISNQEFFGATVCQFHLDTISFTKCTFGGTSLIPGIKGNTSVRDLVVSACFNLPYQCLIDAFPSITSLRLHKLTQKTGGSITQLKDILCRTTNFPDMERLVLCDNSYYLNQARLQEIVSTRVGAGKLRDLEVSFETQKGPALSAFHISDSNSLQRLVLNNCSFVRMKNLGNLKYLNVNRFERKKELSDFRSVDKLVQQFKNTGAKLEEIHIEMDVSTTVAETLVSQILQCFSSVQKILIRNESFYDWSKTHTTATFDEYTNDQLECYSKLQRICAPGNVQCIIVDNSLESNQTTFHQQ